jgi:transposase
MKRLPCNKKTCAISLLRTELSTRLVAERLGVSKAIVARWGARDKQNIPISCAGCLRKLSERDAAAIARMVSTGKLSTATAV